MSNIINLEGKAIIITGAGSGIGRETALVLAKQSATVIMLDVNEVGLTETAALGGENCHPVTIDLTIASIQVNPR